MFLQVSSIRCLDVKIIKNDEVLYEGNVDDAPEELRNAFYDKIEGAYPMVITLAE